MCNNGAVKLSEEGGLFPNEKYMSSTAMMECGIGCVLVVEHGREWRSMLCVDNWDSVAKVWDIDYIHVIELLLQSPGAKKEGGTAPTANPPLLYVWWNIL